MLLLRTAEFKPYCIFIKPPPLKELRTSRLTVQQAGKDERPSNRTNMRTFKVLCCRFKFTKRALWEWSFKWGPPRKVHYLTHPYISLPSLVKHSILSNHYGTCDDVSLQLTFILDTLRFWLRALCAKDFWGRDCFELTYVIAIFPARLIGEVAS